MPSKFNFNASFCLNSYKVETFRPQAAFRVVKSLLFCSLFVFATKNKQSNGKNVCELCALYSTIVANRICVSGNVSFSHADVYIVHRQCLPCEKQFQFSTFFKIKRYFQKNLRNLIIGKESRLPAIYNLIFKAIY